MVREQDSEGSFPRKTLLVEDSSSANAVNRRVSSTLLPRRKGPSLWFMRLASRTPELPGSPPPPALEVLIKDGEQKVITEYAEAESRQQQQAKQEAEELAAKEAALEREHTVIPFVKELRKITNEYRPHFYVIAEDLERRRIEDELRKMGAGDVIDKYKVDIDKLARGDREQREILQGALLLVRTAAQTVLHKPMRFAGDIFPNRVERIVDGLLADGEYSGEDMLDTKDGRKVPIKMRYRVVTELSTKRVQRRRVIPVEYLQEPHHFDVQYTETELTNICPAKFMVCFNEYGEIVKVSDRYTRIGGEHVKESVFPAKHTNFGGEVHGNNGIQTKSFIEENGMNGKGFGNSSFVFQWGNLLTDPTFSIYTRKGKDNSRSAILVIPTIFILDPEGNGMFVLPDEKGEVTYFSKNPDFTKSRDMFEESLGNLPMISIAA